MAGTNYCEVICEGERKVTFSKKEKKKKRERCECVSEGGGVNLFVKKTW